MTVNGIGNQLIRLIVMAAAVLAAACMAAPPPAFESSIASGPKPWTSQPFDDAPDSFAFAVVTDLESGYRPGVFEVAGAIDHFMWITMKKEGPSIANLRLDGVLDKTTRAPANGASLCLDYGKPPCPAPPAR